MTWEICRGKAVLCRTKILEGFGTNIGLMFRPKLGKGESVLLKLPKSRAEIHSFFMFFPIDLFFLDGGFKVIEKAALNPWRVHLPKGKAGYVLEANRGELKIKLGDKLFLKNQGPFLKD